MPRLIMALVASAGQVEKMIEELGGCGCFQWLTMLIGKVAKMAVIWSMYAMVFNSETPAFACIDNQETVHSANSSSMLHTGNYNISLDYNDDIRACRAVNDSTCSDYVFYGNIKTIVNEWSLVCEDSHIPADITTLQMTGHLVGSFIAGHLGDYMGRKPTFFLSLLIIVLSNAAGAVSVNWQMYAAVRFVIGIGCGFYLAVQYNVMTEFVPTRWRARIIAIPAFSFGGGLFALVAWALKDWRHIHILTVAVAFPFLFTCGVIQESVRWLITKGKFQDADTTVAKIAAINKKDKPNVGAIVQFEVIETNKKYSVIDLFVSANRARLTLALLFMWCSISYSYYCLTFGVPKLTGDLYLNMFLMSIIDAPVSLVTMYIGTRYGRKYCCITGFLLTAVFSATLGGVQYLDYVDQREDITIGFALACKMANGIGWGCLMVYTTELYPTVVRSISFGVHNTSARVGAIIAPQMLILNDTWPGLSYFVAAGVLVICALLFCWFPETKNQALRDTFENTEGRNYTTLQSTD